MDLAWLTLAALAVVVVVSCVARVNAGVVAIVLAWLIVFGVSVAGKPPNDIHNKLLDAKSVISGFPAETFLTLLGVSLLFAQAEANGTLARVAAAAQRLLHGRRAAMPWLFFLLALLIGSAGPGNIAAAGLVAPLAMATASRTGISPLVVALLVGHGAIASSVSPFSVAGATANTILGQAGIQDVAWRIYVWNAAANAAVAAVAYVLFRGWQARDDFSAGNQPNAQAKAAALTLAQKTTLAVIGLMVLAVVALKVHVGLAAFCGAVVLAVLGLADERETFLRVPWSVLVMVCGVGVLTALMERTGGTKRFAELLTAASTPGTLPALLAFSTGIISVFSSTTGVVLPAFLPMVKDVAAAQNGADPLGLALAVLVGGNLVDMSPLSTIGALCLAAAPVDQRPRLFNQLLAWGFAMAVAGAAISWLCF
jgi:Na+/H+ antiporter NhaD/arsenite permease-like protein